MMLFGSTVSMKKFSSSTEPLALVRAQGAEDLVASVREVVPAARRDDGFHVGDRADLLRVAAGAVEAERRAPVVQHQRDVAR